jgi:hypothetical protein
MGPAGSTCEVLLVSIGDANTMDPYSPIGTVQAFQELITVHHSIQAEYVQIHRFGAMADQGTDASAALM